jgi:hypothetical protein
MKENKKTMQEIMETFYKERPGIREDMTKITTMLALFNVKWGTELTLTVREGIEDEY